MSKTVWLTLSLILALASAGEGYYIYRLKQEQKQPPVSPWADLDRWMEQSQKELLSGMPFAPKHFDDLFNDKFFSGRFDPFDEIQNFRRKSGMNSGGFETPSFEKAWSDWYKGRLGTADINPEIKTTDKEVVLSLKVPGIKGESLSVNVNKDRIRLAYSSQVVNEDKKKGSYSESIQQSEKILPVPAEADPEKYQIIHDKDEVKIVFEKKKA